VRLVGIDETAGPRGQRYISLFHDLEAARVLYGCDGRDQGTVGQFAEDLRVHGDTPERITVVCIDMSQARLAGVSVPE
jgi:transposase